MSKSARHVVSFDFAVLGCVQCFRILFVEDFECVKCSERISLAAVHAVNTVRQLIQVDEVGGWGEFFHF